MAAGEKQLKAEERPSGPPGCFFIINSGIPVPAFFNLSEILSWNRSPSSKCNGPDPSSYHLSYFSRSIWEEDTFPWIPQKG